MGSGARGTDSKCLWASSALGQHIDAVDHPAQLEPRYDGLVTLQAPSQSLDTGRDLRGRQLAGEDFSTADLRLANLVSANLAGALFTGADLSRALLHGSRLRHAGLDGANLSAVAARDVDLEGASLQGTVLTDADLRGAIFLEADLRGADLRGANLLGADLRGADLTGAILDGAILDGADLARAAVGGGSAVGLQAKAARLRGTTGDLVAAIEAAGGLSRPPLRGGIVLAHGGRFLSTSARRAIALLTPLFLPVRRLAQPLALATQSYLPALWGMIRRSPARVQGAVWSSSADSARVSGKAGASRLASAKMPRLASDKRHWSGPNGPNRKKRESLSSAPPERPRSKSSCREAQVQTSRGVTFAAHAWPSSSGLKPTYAGPNSKGPSWTKRTFGRPTCPTAAWWVPASVRPTYEGHCWSAPTARALDSGGHSRPSFAQQAPISVMRTFEVPTSAVRT